jgi:hypothetical protein
MILDPLGQARWPRRSLMGLADTIKITHSNGFSGGTGERVGFHEGSIRRVVEVRAVVSEARACDVVECEHSAALDVPRNNFADSNRMPFARTCQHRLPAQLEVDENHIYGQPARKLQL